MFHWKFSEVLTGNWQHEKKDHFSVFSNDKILNIYQPFLFFRRLKYDTKQTHEIFWKNKEIDIVGKWKIRED